MLISPIFQANAAGVPDTDAALSRDQFMWGISNGVIVLSIAGGFWLGLAAWTVGRPVFVVAVGTILLISGLLIWRGIRLRRQAAGFSGASLRYAPKGSSIHRINVRFQIVSTGQAVSVAGVGVATWNLHRSDLLWPLIGLVLSLHFLPLAWLFNMRPYYVLGAAGTITASVSLLAFDGGAPTVAVGVGLGLAMLGCVAYLLANLTQLTDNALRKVGSPGGI